ncbi:hypothetical protein C8J56DRAFT_946333 [Mycena floridula]|nr:hypothetical protein C8J56DRAFT_946333 [Mycena floridula]
MNLLHWPSFCFIFRSSFLLLAHDQHMIHALFIAPSFPASMTTGLVQCSCRLLIVIFHSIFQQIIQDWITLLQSLQCVMCFVGQLHEHVSDLVELVQKLLQVRQRITQACGPAQIQHALK